VQATDNVDNTSAWVEAGPVTVSAVTKYYYHGGQRVAMRQGDMVYPGLPGGSQDRLPAQRPSGLDLFNNRHHRHAGGRDALPALRRGALDHRHPGHRLHLYRSSPKQTAQWPDVHQEVLAGGQPGLAIGGQATARHQIVDVRMIG
jgi:hypothetical protein